jgi:hypothetical protein
MSKKARAIGGVRVDKAPNSLFVTEVTKIPTLSLRNTQPRKIALSIFAGASKHLRILCATALIPSYKRIPNYKIWELSGTSPL